jgi:hypothetical protein
MVAARYMDGPVGAQPHGWGQHLLEKEMALSSGLVEIKLVKI